MSTKILGLSWHYYSGLSGKSTFKSTIYCNTEVQNGRYNTEEMYYGNLTMICVEIPLHSKSGQGATVYMQMKS